MHACTHTYTHTHTHRHIHTRHTGTHSRTHTHTHTHTDYFNWPARLCLAHLWLLREEKRRSALETVVWCIQNRLQNDIDWGTACEFAVVTWNEQNQFQKIPPLPPPPPPPPETKARNVALWITPITTLLLLDERTNSDRRVAKVHPSLPINLPKLRKHPIASKRSVNLMNLWVTAKSMIPPLARDTNTQWNQNFPLTSPFPLPLFARTKLHLETVNSIPVTLHFPPRSVCFFHCVSMWALTKRSSLFKRLLTEPSSCWKVPKKIFSAPSLLLLHVLLRIAHNIVQLHWKSEPIQLNSSNVGFELFSCTKKKNVDICFCSVTPAHVHRIMEGATRRQIINYVDWRNAAKANDRVAHSAMWNQSKPWPPPPPPKKKANFICFAGLLQNLCQDPQESKYGALHMAQ